MKKKEIIFWQTKISYFLIEVNKNNIPLIKVKYYQHGTIINEYVFKHWNKLYPR